MVNQLFAPGGTPNTQRTYGAAFYPPNYEIPYAPPQPARTTAFQDIGNWVAWARQPSPTAYSGTTAGQDIRNWLAWWQQQRAAAAPAVLVAPTAVPVTATPASAFPLGPWNRGGTGQPTTYVPGYQQGYTLPPDYATAASVAAASGWPYTSPLAGTAGGPAPNEGPPTAAGSQAAAFIATAEATLGRPLTPQEAYQAYTYFGGGARTPGSTTTPTPPSGGTGKAKEDAWRPLPWASQYDTSTPLGKEQAQKYGGWYEEFQRQHNKMTPEDYYQQTEANTEWWTHTGASPIQQAIDDLEWSQGWRATYGPDRQLTEQDWQLHWYATHGGYPTSDADRAANRILRKEARHERKQAANPPAAKSVYVPPQQQQPIYWGTV